MSLPPLHPDPERPGNYAVALASVLLLSLILLILGLSLLVFMERDYHLAGYQEKSMQARFLALSGLQYYIKRPSTFNPGSSPLRIYLPAGQKQNYCEITLTSQGTIIARGVVTNGYSILAERTLKVKASQPVVFYGDSTL